MRLVDAHCHLADQRFEADRALVVARAQEAGVVQALCIVEATDLEEGARAAELALGWPALRFAVGVHPHHAGRFAAAPEEVTAVVEAALARQPGVCAIGEVGLDYHYQFAPPDVQKVVFRQQIRLARTRRLPLVIHTRDADEETFRVLDEEGAREVGGVFHCFTGDADRARQVLARGFHVSFAGIVTFPRAAALRDAARVVPPTHLLVETDAPYLAPVPYRGRRNEPAWVEAVVAAVAAARGEAPAQVAEAAYAAFVALFRPDASAPATFPSGAAP